MQFRNQWDDDSAWDDIDSALSSALTELMVTAMPDFTPLGAMMMFTSDTIPDKWLWCDGQSLSETTYADLFAVIGHNFGSAGAGFFNLPNMGYKFPLSVDDLSEIGDMGGEIDHTLTIAEMPAHSHETGVSAATGAGNRVARGTNTLAVLQPSTSVGGGAAHNNMPPYIRLAFIIKALP